MLKAVLFLVLVATVAALEKGMMEQVVRIGSIGSTFTDFKGMLVPFKDRMMDGVPAFELRSIVKGIPMMDDDLMSFRCSFLDDFFVPIDSLTKPVLLCRNMKWAREVTFTDRKSFLFSAEDLDIMPGMKMIDLWIGRTMWNDLFSDTTLFHDEMKETVVRIGSIGTHFASLKGLLMPLKDKMIDGIPSFELRSMMKGMAVADDELVSFRCSLLDDFYVPIESDTKPVLLCRNMKWTRDSTVTDKKIFLFGAEHLDLTPDMKMIDLWMGRTTMRDLF